MVNHLEVILSKGLYFDVILLFGLKINLFFKKSTLLLVTCSCFTFLPYRIEPNYPYTILLIPFLFIHSFLASCAKIYCPFDGSCLIDKSTHKPYCKCEPKCKSDLFAPVCGSNNVTYSNECQLKLYSCNQKERLFVKHSGECGELYIFVILITALLY